MAIWWWGTGRFHRRPVSPISVIKGFARARANCRYLIGRYILPRFWPFYGPITWVALSIRSWGCAGANWRHVEVGDGSKASLLIVEYKALAAGRPTPETIAHPVR